MPHLRLPELLRATPLGTLLERMLTVGASDRPDAIEVLRSLEKIHRDHVAGTVFERTDVPLAGPWSASPWSESGPLDTGVTTQVDAEPVHPSPPEPHSPVRPPTGSVPLEVAAIPALSVTSDPVAITATAAPDGPADSELVCPRRDLRWATVAFTVGATLAAMVVMLCVWKLLGAVG